MDKYSELMAAVFYGGLGVFLGIFLSAIGFSPIPIIPQSTIAAWEYRVQKCKKVHIPECDQWFKK